VLLRSVFAVNIPKPQVLMARLMVRVRPHQTNSHMVVTMTVVFSQILACVPNRRRGLGMAIVQSMGSLGPIIHPA
jgi:hypothetical protein